MDTGWKVALAILMLVAWVGTTFVIFSEYEVFYETKSPVPIKQGGVNLNIDELVIKVDENEFWKRAIECNEIWILEDKYGHFHLVAITDGRVYEMNGLEEAVKVEIDANQIRLYKQNPTKAMLVMFVGALPFVLYLAKLMGE